MTTTATAPNGAELHFSAPPADQEVAVAIAVAPPADASAQTLDSGDGPGAAEVQLSPPPPDQPVAGAMPAQPPPEAGARASAFDAAVGAPLGLKDVDYDDSVQDTDLPADDAAPPAAIDIDNQAMYRVIRAVCTVDSGDHAYGAVSADREFTTPGQAGYQKRQFGLGFGLILFTQESGHLGRVLALTKRRDPAGFASTFGTDADALLAVAGADTPADRLRPVAGNALWEQPWLDRFRTAGSLQACQAAQNEEAIEGFFRPLLPIAFGLGFNTDRGLAMVFDRVIVRGLGGGLDWVAVAAGPLRTPAQRKHALDLLGFASAAAFQATVPSLPATGQFDTQTQASLIAALRADGRMPLPVDAQLQTALLAAATGPARERLLRIRDSAAYQDTILRQA